MKKMGVIIVAVTILVFVTNFVTIDKRVVKTELERVSTALEYTVNLELIKGPFNIWYVQLSQTIGNQLVEDAGFDGNDEADRKFVEQMIQRDLDETIEVIRLYEERKDVDGIQAIWLADTTIGTIIVISKY